MTIPCGAFPPCPQTSIERQKVGFGVLIENWLQNELKDCASDLLILEYMKGQRLCGVEQIVYCLPLTKSGIRRNSSLIWII